VRIDEELIEIWPNKVCNSGIWRKRRTDNAEIGRQQRRI